jgi:hypothetical protein
MEISRFSPEPSAEEAAAVSAAIEQFLTDTAPVPVPAGDLRPSPWKRAALAEGVERLFELPL